MVMVKNRCMTHARVTVASLVDTSIAELQQACPEVGPMYNYIAHDVLPSDDILVILEYIYISIWYQKKAFIPYVFTTYYGHTSNW